MRGSWMLVFLVGCGALLDDAEALHARGQAAAAIEVLRSEEGEVPHRAARQRARYALVRGLAHLSLGDREAGRWWLGQAKEIVDDAPDALDTGERARLLDALSALGG